MSRVGDAIRAARNELGLTQEQVATKAKMSRSHLAEIEAGKYSPSIKTLEAIAAACGKQAKDLV